MLLTTTFLAKLFHKLLRCPQLAPLALTNLSEASQKLRYYSIRILLRKLESRFSTTNPQHVPIPNCTILTTPTYTCVGTNKNLTLLSHSLAVPRNFRTLNNITKKPSHASPKENKTPAPKPKHQMQQIQFLPQNPTKTEFCHQPISIPTPNRKTHFPIFNFH